MAIFFGFVIAAFLFAFSVKGRAGHKDLPALRDWYYAHRGLHGDGTPENSLMAFRKARDAGYGIELDVHLMQDGNLAVIHDASLKRTAGADVRIESLSVSQLEQYRLEGTEERIPLLSQVLDLIRGEVPLIVELKSVDDNYATLCETACNLLRDYEGAYCMESFDPRCIRWLCKYRSEVIRGQLTEDFFRTGGKMPWILKFTMRHQLWNVFTRPDFVAYNFRHRKTLSNFLCRNLWGVQGVTWTIRSREELITACQEGWIPIFENFEP